MGAEMKMKAVVHDGVVINIGEWESKSEIPEGAVLDEFDIELSADGKYVLASNYAALRKAEYPSVEDQLEALYDAGVFPPQMASRIRAVKEKYQKR